MISRPARRAQQHLPQRGDPAAQGAARPAKDPPRSARDPPRSAETTGQRSAEIRRRSAEIRRGDRPETSAGELLDRGSPLHTSVRPQAQGLRRGAWRKSAGGTPEKAQGARLGGGAMGEAIASALHRRRAAVVEEGDEGEWSE